MTSRVLVIGAGWSGLASALALAGHADVTVVDAAPQVGGRARRLEVALGDRTAALDNGQHLLIGAYHHTLRLMRALDLPLPQLLLRMPFTLAFPDGFLLRAGALPAPLHLASALLTARGLSAAARLQLALAVARFRLAGWVVEDERDAATLLRGQPPVLLQRLWEPLCLAALNVPLAQASANIFLAVLRDSIGADRRASDLLIPRVDLSTVFAEAAAARLRARGVRFVMRQPVLGATAQRAGWAVHTRDATLDADQVILALPPWSAAGILESIGDGARLAALCKQLRAIAPLPITTAYLRYAEDLRLARPLFALLEDVAAGHYGQWVFDRGALAPAGAADLRGVLSVVISGAGPHLDRTREQICLAVARQLGEQLGLPAPHAAMVITEKRATIAPGPGLKRPAARLPARGLYLAGDAAESAYPSTLEGSVRAGRTAAECALRDSPTPNDRPNLKH